jgi:hypothetical protein
VRVKDFLKSSAKPEHFDHFEKCSGTITRIADNDAAVVYVRLHNQDRTVSFTPKVLRGFAGQDLASFGLRRGRQVALLCDVGSGFVRGAELLDSFNKY